MRRGDPARLRAMARGRALAREARAAAEARRLATLAVACAWDPEPVPATGLRWCVAHGSDDAGGRHGDCWTRSAARRD